MHSSNTNEPKPYTKPGAGSKQDLDNAQFEYDTAASSLSEAESDVAETVITAPMSGVVVGEPKTPGTMAVQGNSSPNCHYENRRTREQNKSSLKLTKLTSEKSKSGKMQLLR